MFKFLKSYYMVRLLLFALLIGTIPVIILGTLSYMRAKDSVQQKVSDSNVQLLRQTELNVEQVLQLFENLMTQYISTSIVNESLDAPISPGSFVMLNGLASGLSKMQPYELGIQDVYLTNLEHRWVLSNQGFEVLDDSPIKDAALDYAKAAGNSFWRTVSSDAGPNAAAPAVRLVKKLPINRTYSNSLIIGEISHSKLEKLVSNEGTTRETVILDRDFQLLTQPPGKVLESSEELKQASELIRNAGDAANGYFTFQVARESIGVHYAKSAYNGWYYLSFASLSDLSKDSRSIGWYTLFISLGTFGLILLFAWVGSTRMYMPIRRVFSAAVGEGTPDELRQGRRTNEFQVIGEHINQLQTTQTHMRDQLRIHAKQLESFFIRRLLQGEIRPGETKERWVQFGYDPSPANFSVMTVQIDTLEQTRYGEQDSDLLLFAIGNIASELIPADRRFEPVVMVDNQVTICRGEAGAGPALEEAVYDYAELLQRKASELLGLKVSVGLSAIYSDINSTSQAYKESLEALKYRVRFGESVILPYTNVLPDTPMAAAYPEWLEKELLGAIKMEERAQARQLLGEFIRKAIADNPRYFDLQMVLNRLLIDLLREWQEAGETANPLYASGKPIQEHLLELRTAEEIEAWFFRKIIEPMMEFLHLKWESQNKKISERMLEMIHEEYDTALTLELCASRLNYHPNYIKTVFRKETGTSFSDYLSQHRLNVAKQWLVETDMKVSEIAEKLQYNNSQNFIRYFRKLEGTTPGQYRETHRS